MRSFDDADLFAALLTADNKTLDALDFGVVSLDANLVCTHYNRIESEHSGLSPERVIGLPFFDQVAPCMNNRLVADKLRRDGPLDETLSYTLSVRIRPTLVRLRMLAAASTDRRFLLVDWL